MHRIALAAIVLATALALTPQRAVAQQPTAPSVLAAQERLRTADPSATYIVRTRGGSTFIGRVASVRGDSVTLEATVGTLVLRLADVVSAAEVRPQDIRDGEYWFPNPNVTRLLFAPTGRMLPAGEGYFSDYLLFFPGIAFGVTDRVTLGGGVSIIPAVGIEDQLLYFTPKVGVISRPDLNVAVGVLAMRAGLGNEEGESSNSFGIAYTVATYGGENASVTGGIGYGYQGGTMSDRPAAMLGGEMRVAKRFGFLTENYVFPGQGSGGLLSLGGRFFGEKMSVDFGVLRIITSDDGFTSPFVGFVVNF